MSGTIPPVYLRVYLDANQCWISSAYASFSAAALRLAGAKIFLSPRLILSCCSSQRSGVLSSADVISRNSWTICSGLDSAKQTYFRHALALPCIQSCIFQIPGSQCGKHCSYDVTVIISCALKLVFLRISPY